MTDAMITLGKLMFGRLRQLTAARVTPVYGLLRGFVIVSMAAFSMTVSLGNAVHAAPESGQSGTFLPSFPDKDLYRVTVIGDDFAFAMTAGLSRLLAQDSRVALNSKILSFAGIMTSSFDAKAQSFAADIATNDMSVAVVMMGYWDRVSLRSSSGRRVRAGSDEWLTEYQRRMATLMKTLKDKNIGVYWVGLPILSKATANERAQKMNDIIREQAYLSGFKYIDAYTAFADETARYSSYGPDLDGKIRVLRTADGIGFTKSGATKLAHFVEQEMKRDMRMARASRATPLLGAPEEQAKVNPNNANRAPAPSSPLATGGAAKQPVATARGTVLTQTRDEQADNGKITMRVKTADGREEQQVIKIVRPAIPASVVSLMARRQTSGQMGDMLVDQLPGGQTLMSSITSSGRKTRGRIAPTQAPYFRLLVKGERLTPKPGRADDTSWPDAGKASRNLTPRAMPGNG